MTAFSERSPPFSRLASKSLGKNETAAAFSERSASLRSPRFQKDSESKIRKFSGKARNAGEKTGQRGVLLTMGMLLLILSVAALAVAFSGWQKDIGRVNTESSAAAGVADRFSNIVSAIADLDREGNAKGVLERVLPFSYGINGNRITAMSELPVRSEEIGHYFDVINMYAVFVNDENSFAFERQVGVEASAARNAAWDGNANMLRFVVMPQCSVYGIRDYNHVGFLPGTAQEHGCESDYNSQKLLRYDANINIKYDFADYNAVVCSVIGYAGCPANEFNALDARPYFSARIIDANCTRCMLGAFPEIISAHYNDAVPNSVQILCSGAGCTSKPVTITIDERISVDHNSSQRIDATVSAEFRNRIQGFGLADFNVAVRRGDFGVSAAR